MDPLPHQLAQELLVAVRDDYQSLQNVPMTQSVLCAFLEQFF